MENFWKWFADKTGFNALHWINMHKNNSNQNLIGHMEEYLVSMGREVPPVPKDTIFEMRAGLKFSEIRTYQLENEIRLIS